MNGARRHGLAMTAGTSAGARGAALVLLCGLHAGAAQAQGAAPPQNLPAPDASTPATAPAVAPDATAPTAHKNTLSAADAAEAAAAAKDEILVTAHRQRGAVATDVPPETTINATAIHALGAADLDEVFADLAPEIGGGATTTLGAAQPPIILVNGQRVAGFSTIKDLPPEAVRRIEVFPEQVALQYGYGPNQRVVNVVLRASYRALTLLGRYTLAPDNFRGVYRAKVDLLRISENAHWNIDLDYRHQDPIFADTTLAGPTTDGTVPRHTLATQDDHLTLSGLSNRKFGNVTAELTGSLDLETIQSRPGLQDVDGDLLASQGLADLISGPLNRSDSTVEAQTNLTLNGKLDDGWRWSYVGRLDDTTHVTRTDPAVGNAGMALVTLPSPGLLGTRCATAAADCVSTDLRTASSDVYLNGNVFNLPAGAITASLRTGVVFSGIRSDSPLVPMSTTRDRTESNAQADVEFPLTSRDSFIGKLTVGGNGEARKLSDFGTLTTAGSTLDWSPIKPVDFLASFSHTQQAPTLLQLGEAGLDTPDLREFDFVNDTTSIVQRITGGNADLDHETSRIAKFRLQVTPLHPANLTLSAEYTIQRTRNPIANITAATAQTMAAFPDNFTRQNGYLTSIDVSPVNLARRDTDQLHYGINYSTAFGPTHLATATSAESRDQFQIALYDTWRTRDDVWLRQGTTKLDLLDGDVISDIGGTPAHQIELQTTVSTPAWSADINAMWQTHTTATAGTLAQDSLTFSQGITFNLRLQINLADQHWLNRIFPALRGSLNISADNLLGAHTVVHQNGGGVPAAYSQSYLNPTGRTFRITLRKRFR